MKRLVVPVLAFSLATIACGSDATGDSAGTPTHPPDPDTVVLSIGFEGGLAPVDATYDPMPVYVLFSDGRLVYQGATPGIFPGPILPSLEVAQLNDDQAFEVLDKVDQVGLPQIGDERDDNLDDAGNVADAPDTVFTFTDDNGEHRYAVYALGITDTPSQQRHAAAQDLVALLGDLSASADQLGDYEIERLHILISEDFGANGDLEPTIVPWPLSTPVANFTPVVRDVLCHVFEGQAAQEALTALGAANQLTFWDDGGTRYRPRPRPLFPGETGCPALP
jgi:hypothetical protein